MASSATEVVTGVVHLWGFSYLNTSGKETARDQGFHPAACPTLLEPSYLRLDLPAQGILGIVVSERIETDT